MEDRDKATVKAFLESIPLHLNKTVKVSVLTCMMVLFMLHLACLVSKLSLLIDIMFLNSTSEPLDKLRIKECARLKRELSQYESWKLEAKMRILRKKHECLT